MSGFFSKELILEKLLDSHMYGHWVIAIAGAFLTAFYSFRLFFVIFLGEAKKEPDMQASKTMVLPLSILALLAIFGGIQPQGLIELFNPPAMGEHSISIMAFTIAVPICALIFSFIQFRRGVFGKSIQSSWLKKVRDFLYSGWAFDWFYQKVFVKPFISLAMNNKNDIVDQFPKNLVKLSRSLNKLFAKAQTGQLRWYSGSLVIFSVAALALLIIG